MKNKLMTAEEYYDEIKLFYNKWEFAEKYANYLLNYHLKQFVDECKKHTVTLKVDNIETSFLVVDKSSIDQTLTNYLNKL